MEYSTLADVLANWREFELDDSLYMPAGSEISLDLAVNVLPFDPTRRRSFEGQVYLLGIEQIRDVLAGLETQLGRAPSLTERLKAIAHFVQYDAFIPLSDL